MGPLFHACSRVQFIIGQVGVLRVPRYALGPRLVGWFRNFCPPSAGLVFGPSSVRLFFSLALTQCRRRSPNVAVNCHSRMEPYAPQLQRVPNEAKNDAKTRPERGQKIALETLSFSIRLPPARQQVSSRSLEAVSSRNRCNYSRKAPPRQGDM